jgi:hypothetical protein
LAAAACSVRLEFGARVQPLGMARNWFWDTAEVSLGSALSSVANRTPLIRTAFEMV